MADMLQREERDPTRMLLGWAAEKNWAFKGETPKDDGSAEKEAAEGGW